MRKYLKKTYKGDFVKLKKIITSNIEKNKKMFIVTANPETLIQAYRNKELSDIILKNTIVADGIGIVKACKRFEKPVTKIPGIDIANFLLEISEEKKLKIVLIGASSEVNDLLAKKIKTEKKHIKVVGSIDGYDNLLEEKIEKVLKLKPDVVLVALGIPKQELLINKYYKNVSKGIFIGVGGAFDVISGVKKRAPKIFLKTNTEWLYRIVKEPVRLKRFYNNNIKFYFMVRR